MTATSVNRATPGFTGNHLELCPNSLISTGNPYKKGNLGFLDGGDISLLDVFILTQVEKNRS